MDAPRNWQEELNRIKRYVGECMEAQHMPPGQQRDVFRNINIQVTNLQQDMENTMLLFPDVRKKQHDAQEFVFAYPCSTSEWFRLMAEAKKTTQKEQYKSAKAEFLKYMFVKDDEEDICIIPRPAEATDDDCLGTAAFIRMVAEFRGMIYAVPSTCDTNQSNSIASIIARTAGVPPHQVRHVEV